MLKLKDTLPSVRQVGEDDIPAHWYEDDEFDAEGVEDEETNSDDSQ